MYNRAQLRICGNERNNVLLIIHGNERHAPEKHVNANCASSGILFNAIITTNDLYWFNFDQKRICSRNKKINEFQNSSRKPN